MTSVTTIRLLLGVSALTVMAGGAWLAVLGGSADGVAVTSPGEETSAPPAGSMTAIAQATGTDRKSVV